MVIKNKDGSNYSLRKPIETNQTIWNDDVILHNFKQQIIKSKETSKMPEPIITPMEEPIIEEEIIEELPKIVESQSIKPKNIILIHCLPVILNEITDDLYGEKKSRFIYGEKFIFEAKLINLTAFGIKLETKIELNEGTILYPTKYADGRSISDFHWWRVNSVTKIENEFEVIGSLSNIQPDFS